MIRFPETVEREWSAVETAAKTTLLVRKRINRGVSIENEVEKLHVRHEARLRFQAEIDAQDTPPLVMGTIADFLASGQSVPEDMIEGVMKVEGMCTVLGPSGVGKTTLALQMVHSVMTGDDWLGQVAKPISGAAGILSYDQNSAMMTNWISASGVDPTRVSMVDAHGRGNPLAVPSMRSQIAGAWKDMGVEVVLIDSFSASFHGMDQNDAALTMAYYRDMKKFAYSEVGAKVLIVILHSSDSNPTRPRGSTTHKDVADTMVSITLTDPTDKNSARRVRMEKYREGIGQSEMTPVIVGAPDDVTHLVSLDLGAMTLEGLPIPPRAAASVAFTAMPDPNDQPEPPDTEIDEEDDDL